MLLQETPCLKEVSHHTHSDWHWSPRLNEKSSNKPFFFSDTRFYFSYHKLVRHPSFGYKSEFIQFVLY